MSQSAFSLSWSAHNSNICSGLSTLQQNGEFVDMTLAADGHHVKVHQIIMALASPYLRELITSAQCPHPVIFLNKVSYNTLSAILEYIYTGEVQVSLEYLADLIDAGKELHIKGLEDMDFNQPPSAGFQKDFYESRKSPNNDTQIIEEYCLFDVDADPKDQKYTICIPERRDDTQDLNEKSVDIEDSLEGNTFEELALEETAPLDTNTTQENMEDIQFTVNQKLPPTAKLKKPANPDEESTGKEMAEENTRSGKEMAEENTRTGKKKKYAQVYKKEWEAEFPGWLQDNPKGKYHAFCKYCHKDINISSGKDALNKHKFSRMHTISAKNIKKLNKTPFTVSKDSNRKIQVKEAGIMQYTVSNQGSLQMILNRFLYYLKHSKRDGTRQWRCVDYLCTIRCPAMVLTKDDIVIQRMSAHVHPLHDKKILKKIQDGSVFTAIREAVKEGNIKKNRKAAIIKAEKSPTTE